MDTADPACQRLLSGNVFDREYKIYLRYVIIIDNTCKKNL